MSSIWKADLEQKLLGLVSPALATLGYRIVDLDVRESSRSLVRLFIERCSREGNVSIEDCAAASRKVGELLEAEEWFSGPFDLEVSSPGLDRRLRTQADFESSIGGEVKLKLLESIQGLGANARGVLLFSDPQGIRLRVSGNEFFVPYEKIVKAHRVWSPGVQERK